MMQYVYKMWGAMGGYLIGALFAGLIANGMATCVDPANMETCTVLGVISPEWVRKVIEVLFVGLGAYIAPRNVYPDVEAKLKVAETLASIKARK
jgi:hypothetical protein